MFRTHLLVLITVASSAAGCQTGGVPAEARGADQPSAYDRIERGRYLVNGSSCNDCHTPLIMGPNGPQRDAARLLAGHPEGLVLPPAPVLPDGPWIGAMSESLTAWSGPWGTSFTANLTPDPDTGLGAWTTDDFISTIRNGRHMGKGRKLLPPMPADMIAAYSDDDLAAIFAYLQSIPPVKNKVPEPLPPAARPAG